jgi:hypothetical protein
MSGSPHFASNAERYKEDNSTNFKERFKGRISSISKEGHLGVVANLHFPIAKSPTAINSPGTIDHSGIKDKYALGLQDRTQPIKPMG